VLKLPLRVAARRFDRPSQCGVIHLQLQRHVELVDRFPEVLLRRAIPRYVQPPLRLLGQLRRLAVALPHGSLQGGAGRWPSKNRAITKPNQHKI
jgi:hypothetical protein